MSYYYAKLSGLFGLDREIMYKDSSTKVMRIFKLLWQI